MQQTREPSRFSKEPRFGAISQRADRAPAAAARCSPLTPSATATRDSRTAVASGPDGAARGAVGEALGDHAPEPTAAAAPTGRVSAPERPKTGHRRPRTAEPVKHPIPAEHASVLDEPGSPRFAQRQARQATHHRASRPAAQRQLKPAATATHADTREPRRAPPPPLSPYLEGLVTRYSEELHDEDHIPQNLGQAGRLWQASGWSESDFIHALHEAKSITVKRDIKKRATYGGDFGARNKMPYYFKVLRDMLGLKAPDAAAPP